MSRRIEQFNDQLRHELAQLVSKEIQANSLITISDVKCSPDLKFSKIYISILPEQLAGQSIKELKKHSSQFCQILRKKLKIRQIPKFNWIIDKTESEATEIEEVLKKINKNF